MIALVAAWVYMVLWDLGYLFVHDGIAAVLDSRKFFAAISIAPLLPVLFTSWFVFPLGAVVGILTARLSRTATRRKAMVLGACLGAINGALAAVGALVVTRSPYILIRPEGSWGSVDWDYAYRMLLLAILIIPFSALCVGLHAWRQVLRRTA